MLSHVAIIWSLVPLTFQLAIPITLAAIGGTISERSGIINIGLEGMMLVGAFGGVLGSYLTGNGWMGVLFALLFGGAIGLVHAVVCIRYKGNQVVSGVGINIVASGLTTVLLRYIWKTEGISAQVTPLDRISVPLLKNIPYVGDLFHNQSPLLYIMLLVVIGSWFLMYKTRPGLRLRALGDHPRAVRAAGISVARYRYVSVIVSGMLAGLGGAYLSIAQNNVFVKDMSAGRGFIALAANIFGGWNPAGSFGASMIFAFSQAVRLNLLGIQIPVQFVQMLPYVVTLVVLVAVGRKSRAPESLGESDE
ncbi:MAG TPA: ABC transporter permease [Spirochaetia bacterium]|nr:ABC transporter permease [Spirochaetia bacterium]